MKKDKPIRHKVMKKYTPIMLTIKNGSKDLRLLLKVLEPAKKQPFNYSKFYPAGPNNYVITICIKDFSDFFQRLDYYANINRVGEPIEGLTLYRDLAAGYLYDLIYHLYGFSCWGDGRTIQEY